MADLQVPNKSIRVLDTRYALYKQMDNLKAGYENFVDTMLLEITTLRETNEKLEKELQALQGPKTKSEKTK